MAPPLRSMRSQAATTQAGRAGAAAAARRRARRAGGSGPPSPGVSCRRSAQVAAVVAEGVGQADHLAGHLVHGAPHQQAGADGGEVDLDAAISPSDSVRVKPSSRPARNPPGCWATRLPSVGVQDPQGGPEVEDHHHLGGGHLPAAHGGRGALAVAAIFAARRAPGPDGSGRRSAPRSRLRTDRGPRAVFRTVRPPPGAWFGESSSLGAGGGRGGEAVAPHPSLSPLTRGEGERVARMRPGGSGGRTGGADASLGAGRANGGRECGLGGLRGGGEGGAEAAHDVQEGGEVEGLWQELELEVDGAAVHGGAGAGDGYDRDGAQDAGRR